MVVIDVLLEKTKASSVLMAGLNADHWAGCRPSATVCPDTNPLVFSLEQDIRSAADGLSLLRLAVVL